MCSCINIHCIYTKHLSPALNGSPEIQRFECSDTITMVRRIIMGHPHSHYGREAWEWSMGMGFGE